MSLYGAAGYARGDAMAYTSALLAAFSHPNVALDMRLPFTHLLRCVP